MINTSVKTTTCDILRNDNKKYNLCYDIGENGSKTYAGFNNMKDLINGINAVQNVLRLKNSINPIEQLG